MRERTSHFSNYREWLKRQRKLRFVAGDQVKVFGLGSCDAEKERKQTERLTNQILSSLGFGGNTSLK